MDRGAWWATVHGVEKNQTRLEQLSTYASQFWGVRIWAQLSWGSLVQGLPQGYSVVQGQSSQGSAGVAVTHL